MVLLVQRGLFVLVGTCALAPGRSGFLTDGWLKPTKPTPKLAGKELYPEGFPERSESHPGAAPSQESTPSHPISGKAAEVLRDLSALSFNDHPDTHGSILQYRCKHQSPIAKKALILRCSNVYPFLYPQKVRYREAISPPITGRVSTRCELAVHIFHGFSAINRGLVSEHLD